MRWPSFSLILSGVFLGYISYSVWSLAQLFVPPACGKGERCIPSFLRSKPKLHLALFTSVKPHPSLKDVKFVESWRDFNYTFPKAKELNLTIPLSTRQNGSMYLHLLLTQEKEHDNFFKLHQTPTTVYTKIRLTQYHVPEAATFQLLGSKENKIDENISGKSIRPVAHLKSRITFNILTDDIKFPVKNLPPEIAQLLVLNSRGEFLPIIQYDFLNNRLRDLVVIGKNDTIMMTTLAYAPVSTGKLRVMQHIETALRSLMSFGFNEKDVDEVKGIFADTNMYLLCITVFVAAVHLLFDFLAFKNDVTFWRHKQNFAGLSVRTVVWRAFSHIIVFLYMMDEKTSLLVLIPSGIATVIELWKAQKVIYVEVTFSKLHLPCLRFTSKGSSAAEQKTQEFDAEIMRYLSYILYPCCILGAIYSLLYVPHKSWYSWSIHSLVNGVYVFGFLFMLPQLFVNYKLKSVAHLPWRAFMYKAFNTFIDDLFAFIITMPTAHRVACFRDDIVFLVYLYQRWLYPVDKTRVDGTLVTDEKKHE
ncbi:cleft lip and palate transmembrane protein 1-like protein [Schistocerca cancellata]|uniref:cleft lip and palate transmembrane protein 1-like protein n=1 Tax=Schistocerca cancellata TaxID=274614 RepID=UPI00211813D6|nr:cleft lip and palate transmembrane protein 1-like protein [Schistocerca cancellata]